MLDKPELATKSGDYVESSVLGSCGVDVHHMGRSLVAIVGWLFEVSTRSAVGIGHNKTYGWTHSKDLSYVVLRGLCQKSPL